jgi:hypothetical protein
VYVFTHCHCVTHRSMTHFPSWQMLDVLTEKLQAKLNHGSVTRVRLSVLVRVVGSGLFLVLLFSCLFFFFLNVLFITLTNTPTSPVLNTLPRLSLCPDLSLPLSLSLSSPDRCSRTTEPRQAALTI